MTKKGVISVTATLKVKHSCGQSMVERRTELKVMEQKTLGDFIPLNWRQGVKCLLCETDMLLSAIAGSAFGDGSGIPCDRMLELTLHYYCEHCSSNTKHEFVDPAVGF